MTSAMEEAGERKSGRRWRGDFQSSGPIGKIPAVVGQWERGSLTWTAGLFQFNIFSTLSVVPKKPKKKTQKALKKDQKSFCVFINTFQCSFPPHVHHWNYMHEPFRFSYFSFMSDLAQSGKCFLG